MQVQTSSTEQQVVMSTANLRGMASVLPQGTVLMQQAIPASSLPSQLKPNTASSQPNITILSNKSSSLSRLSLLAQHPQGHAAAATSQIQIKPNGTATFTTVSKPGQPLQRQVIPVQTLPGTCKYSVQYMYSIIRLLVNEKNSRKLDYTVKSC